MRWMLHFLEPAPYQPITQTTEEIEKNYRYWRIRICYSIFLGYALFYFTRKSFTFAMPYMSADLGLTKGDFGLFIKKFTNKSKNKQEINQVRQAISIQNAYLKRMAIFSFSFIFFLSVLIIFLYEKIK